MGTPIKDATIPEDAPQKLLLDKHVDFIAGYGRERDEYEYAMTEYLRMSGMYWGCTVLDLMHSLDRLPAEEVLDYVKKCQGPSGGVSPAPDHDPHLLYTLSAVQLCVLYDRWDALDLDQLTSYVCSLQQEDGSFSGDEWGEIDTRFSFCAAATLSLMGRLSRMNVPAAVEYVRSCMNFDGGFGCRPGSESHSGQIYCCLGFLSIVGRLDIVNIEELGWWLSERQLPSGGLNGRPEKLPDVCYSWWVLASLRIIGKLHWIHRDKLVQFILACQDAETGGFADRPGDMPDPFHTLFGIAGLSLMKYPDLKPVNPVFCLPQDCLDKVSGLKPQILEQQ